DFNFAAPGYQEHAADWMASQSIEFANETTLMCYNAAGWREHLEKQWISSSRISILTVSTLTTGPTSAFVRTPATVAGATLAALRLRVITTSPSGRGVLWLATRAAKGSCSSTRTCCCSPE